MGSLSRLRERVGVRVSRRQPPLTLALSPLRGGEGILRYNAA
jgi:hypothetical protein